MSDTGFTNEGLAVRACRGHFHVTVGGCDLALPGDPFPTREAALDVAFSEATARVTALELETSDLHRLLDEKQGECDDLYSEISAKVSARDFTIQELRATVAALTAENERMKQALIDVASYGYADTFIRDRARVALPSSRETTDG